MRVAALYDIHAILPALDAVLHEVHEARVDEIVIGGDVVPGPMPRETLARLLAIDLPVRCIHGNGEVAVLGELAGKPSDEVPESGREMVRWSAAQLRPEDEAVLASWPQTLRLRVPPLGEVLFCHATPRSVTEIFTRLTPDDRLLPIFDPVDAPLVVCGHTHMQFDRRIGRTRVVNAGSVGMPFGPPGADWLLLGPDVELRHTPYDVAAAAERIGATEFPNAAAFAARFIVNPPSEADMLQTFASSELK
jgi:diadenosine tetraphosphatase ApaH/serine/threonine PP2A family protein phosphatase